MKPSSSATGSSSWTRAGSPLRARHARLIEKYSTKEVVELRFAPGQHEEVAPSLTELAERQEVLPDRILLYTDDGDAALAEVARMGHVARATLVRRSTLEDVFLRLTGRSLVD